MVRSSVHISTSVRHTGPPSVVPSTGRIGLLALLAYEDEHQMKSQFCLNGLHRLGLGKVMLESFCFFGGARVLKTLAIPQWSETF